jgi:hypothetical protein
MPVGASAMVLTSLANTNHGTTWRQEIRCSEIRGSGSERRLICSGRVSKLSHLNGAILPEPNPFLTR